MGKAAWSATGSGNMVRNLSDYGYLSYIQRPRNMELEKALVALGNMVQQGTTVENNPDFKLAVKDEETALTDGKQWLILTGDMRVEYAPAQTFAEAKAIYDELAPAHRSSWSTDRLDEIKVRETNDANNDDQPE